MNRPCAVESAPFAGYRFPPEVILLAVRWYLRYGLSYRDVEELLAERGIDVDPVTIYRWVQRFTPLLIDAAQKLFETALVAHGRPAEVTTDLAAPLLRVIDELIPEAIHDTEHYSNDRVENDHGRLKARLRPMRGLRTDRTASVVVRGHAFIQNLRRGHYELGVEARHPCLRLAAALDELAEAI
ncbi:MAG: IS6 family transposase [Actinomycetia bacterium]|nr:IS6 family transposase [Actinomycetes bacterium]